jgi:hypothetical protein
MKLRNKSLDELKILKGRLEVEVETLNKLKGQTGQTDERCQVIKEIKALARAKHEIKYSELHQDLKVMKEKGSKFLDHLQCFEDDSENYLDIFTGYLDSFDI